MKPAHQNIITKIHLVLSVLVVVPAAIIYGYFPDSVLEISPNTVDEHNFHKAIMGLYLGCALLWVLGIFRRSFLRIALSSNMVFMLGLGLGRALSILSDGMPSLLYFAGMFGELILGLYGLWVLVKIPTIKTLNKKQ